MSRPSERAAVLALAVGYARRRIERTWPEAAARPCPTGLTLHNLARSRVTPGLLALARINYRRKAEAEAARYLRVGFARLLDEVRS